MSLVRTIVIAYRPVLTYCEHAVIRVAHEHSRTHMRDRANESSPGAGRSGVIRVRIPVTRVERGVRRVAQRLRAYFRNVVVAAFLPL